MKRVITILVMVCSFLPILFGGETVCFAPDIQHSEIIFTLKRTLPISEHGFSINDSTKIFFALGNLQYKPSNGEWRFAPRQFDYVGGGYSGDGKELPNGEYGTIYENGVKCWNIKYDNPITSSHIGWLDVFGFNEFSYTDIIIAEKKYNVPTKGDLEYLVKSRVNSGQLRARARIILDEPTPDGNTFVNGIILLPDDWNPKISIFKDLIPDLDGVTGCWYYYDNKLTENEWHVLEAQGAVFFPAAGNATGRSNSKYNRSGFYWTSTPGTKSNQSITMEFGGYPYGNQNTTPSFSSQNKTYRRSFRLYLDSVDIKNNYSCAEYDSINIRSNGGVIIATQDPNEECDWRLAAVPSNGYKFAYWKDIQGVISNTPTINVTLDSTKQNALWQVIFVRDNAYIHDWASDSIIFRADTTDILSNSLSDGEVKIYVDDDLVEQEAVKRCDYGVWSNSIDGLVTGNIYAGERLHAVIHNSCGNVSAVIDTIVPFVINGLVSASDIEIPDCDVHVFDGSKLIIDVNTAFPGYLYIHEGGTVVIEATKTLEVGGVVVRGNGINRKWGQILVEGQLINNNSNTIYYDYTLNSKEYYPLALPSDVLCKDLTNAVTGGVPSFVSYVYNTGKRNTGVSGWEEYDDLADGALYETGKGYLIYAAGIKWKGQKSLRQKTSILRFPLVIDLSEKGEEEKSAFIFNDDSDNIQTINRNWNFIGNPYLCNFKVGNYTSDTAKITQGYYELVGDHYELVTTGEGALRYITYSLDGYRSYKQERISGFTMKPFNSYFVQTSCGNAITFNKFDIEFHAPNRVIISENETKEIETGIMLRQDSCVDRAGFLFGNFTNDYDINADLYKEIGTNQPMSVYSFNNNNPMAFQALPYNMTIESIRIGYQRAKLNEMTFSFDDEWYKRDGIKEMWLTDTHTGAITNLMVGDYTFLPEHTQEDSRFYLSLVLYSELSTKIDDNTVENVRGIYNILGNKVNKEMKNNVYIVFYNDGTVRKEIR